jgi:hypothetical protein
VFDAEKVSRVLQVAMHAAVHVWHNMVPIDGTTTGQFRVRQRGTYTAARNGRHHHGGAVRDEHLYAFVADTRAKSAAGVRRRTRWLRQQLRADTSFDAVCRDLLAAAPTVEVFLTSGRRCRGRVTGVGADVLVLRAGAATTYVAMRAVVGVRSLSARDAENSTDTPTPVRDTQLFVDVLADLADHRDRVEVGTVAPTTHRGILGGLAHDFIWFDDNARYLRLETITDVTAEAAS